MSAQDWAGFIFTLLSIGGVVLGGIRWYIKVQFEPVQNSVEEIRAETKTNGGSSMRDEIKSIKAQQVIDCQKREEMDKKIDKSTEKIDHMYDVLLDYIANKK